MRGEIIPSTSEIFYGKSYVQLNLKVSAILGVKMCTQNLLPK